MAPVGPWRALDWIEKSAGSVGGLMWGKPGAGQQWYGIPRSKSRLDQKDNQGVGCRISGRDK
ncbi:MAG: hypothetical protein BA865_00910 [Desulfobacterales bacterium S5133MH4]|nr:MAG: hypothetical protein BA865_00910 [Desulfobacterales bacterium S5133MH4]